MSDKFSAMSNEQVAAATLAMMGYTERQPGVWRSDVIGNAWQASDALSDQLKHLFAAEAKEWMMKDWSIEDYWLSFEVDPRGYVEFVKISEMTKIVGEAIYLDMDTHPRAVCVAALRAKDAEKGGRE